MRNTLYLLFTDEGSQGSRFSFNKNKSLKEGEVLFRLYACCQMVLTKFTNCLFNVCKRRLHHKNSTIGFKVRNNLRNKTVDNLAPVNSACPWAPNPRLGFTVICRKGRSVEQNQI